MAYTITLNVFEGPLDLLLHLIQKNKIDIYNIPIAEVTEQYLSYLQAMQELDLEVASEFLVMAATLLAIKAKMLLPQGAQQAEEGSEEDLDDPRKELVDRLIEYQKYKNAAERLKERQAKQALMFSRPLDPIFLEETLKKVNPVEKVSVEDLKNLVTVLLNEVATEAEIKEIARGIITVKDKMDYIEECLSQESEGILFQNLFSANSSTLTIVVTFLALLELIHLQRVFVIQTANFGPLRIYPRTLQSEGQHAV
mgnify:CR=1 FL=1